MAGGEDRAASHPTPPTPARPAPPRAVTVTQLQTLFPHYRPHRGGPLTRSLRNVPSRSPGRGLRVPAAHAAPPARGSPKALPPAQPAGPRGSPQHPDIWPGQPRPGQTEPGCTPAVDWQVLDPEWGQAC